MYYLYAPSLGSFSPRLFVAKSRYERLREVKRKNTSPYRFALKFEVKYANLSHRDPHLENVKI